LSISTLATAYNKPNPENQLSVLVQPNYSKSQSASGIKTYMEGTAQKASCKTKQ